MPKITYADKETLISNPTMPDKNKITMANMNEIKKGVNELETEKVSKSGDTMTGDLKFGSTLIGVYGKDKNGVQYPFVYDNGGNFWIGASGSGSTGVHHTGGGTYISGGEGYVYASRLIDGVRTNAIIIDTKNMGSQLVTIFPSGADLDNYKTAGFYQCSSSSIAQGTLNCPTTYAFSLLVEKHAGAKQTITTYNTSGQIIYTRNFYNNVWGAWRELAFVDDTGWITPTLNTGLTHVSGIGVQYRRVGKRVEIRGRCTGISIENTNIFTLPIGYRPSLILNPVTSGTGVILNKLGILTDGVVRLICRHSGGTQVYDSTAFITLDTSFFVD